MAVGSGEGRTLKKQVFALLDAEDFDAKLSELLRLPARQVVNALFSFLLNKDETIRWRAVSAMGAVVDNLARDDMEAARDVMRRLIWSLNEESGGIGWGAPEVMGEIMARNEALGKEYATIFVSYLDERGNFLRLQPLQRGLLWGLVQLARNHPGLLKAAGPHLRTHLSSTDPCVRGLAALAAGLLRVEEVRPELRSLAADDHELSIYMGSGFVSRRVRDLAEEAIAILDNDGARPAG